MKEWTITISQDLIVTEEDVDDIMCTALEGGIYYWCKRAEVVGAYLGDYASDQIARGGELILYDRESANSYKLTLDKLLKGIAKAYADGYYDEYEWCDGKTLDLSQIDAELADVIVQLALFDEVVYG
mgnify:CR=1 FL=1